MTAAAQPDLILLKPRLLTAADFAPYGEVIETRGVPIAINYGQTQRFHDLAHIDPGEDGKAIVSIFRSQPVMLPFMIKVMECHPLGSQAFMPLDGRPYIVVVAPAGPFDPHGMEAFCANGHQGVNFRRGTWHHYNLALEAPSNFMVVDRAGPGTNLQEMTLRHSVTVLSSKT